jgi:hypothetical protein
MMPYLRKAPSSWKMLGSGRSTEFHHFVAEASDGSVGYDPIEGGSRTVREGHLESKRIYLVV